MVYKIRVLRLQLLLFSGWRDVMYFSLLPPLRLPILLVQRLICMWFATSDIPSVNNMASVLGLSGAMGGCAQVLARRLLLAESKRAVNRQRKRKLSGILECDGTSLRSWKIGGTQNLAYVQLFGSIQRHSRKTNLYDIGLGIAKNLGKPPPESWNKISKTRFFEDVEKTDLKGRTTCIISDGAKVYPKIKKHLRLLHRSVSHAKGEFQRTDRLWGSTVSVHTGGIDQAWSSLKANIPKSVATRKHGQVNPQLWSYCTQWQWRFENHLHANLSRLTAQTLRSL